MKLNYHRTPHAVVSILKRHVPRTARKILDPAVGEGALLNALNSAQLKGSLTLIDVDPRRLDAIRAVNSDLTLISADFISWSLINKDDKYELIITNPPFSAKSGKWISHDKQTLPIEVVFFRQCVSLLKDGGTLLAIVPDTLINSMRLQNERKKYSLDGAFVYVYQLPAKSFSNIEGVFYLIVFKKGMKQGRVTLRNTNGSSEVIITPEEFARLGYRLDHSFYQSRFVLEKLVSSGSQPLSGLCNINRGPIRNNYKDENHIHSDSFDGAWRSYLNYPCDRLCVGVKRVSRDAHLSFGLFPVSCIPKSTDCIVFVRPYLVDAFEILFFLRVIFSNELGRSLLLKGAGAKFIQVQVLKDLPYFKLHEEYKAEFLSYKKAYIELDFVKCNEIEASICTSLVWGSKVSSIKVARSDAKVPMFLDKKWVAITDF